MKTVSITHANIKTSFIGFYQLSCAYCGYVVFFEVVYIWFISLYSYSTQFSITQFVIFFCYSVMISHRFLFSFYHHHAITYIHLSYYLLVSTTTFLNIFTLGICLKTQFISILFNFYFSLNCHYWVPARAPVMDICILLLKNTRPSGQIKHK